MATEVFSSLLFLCTCPANRFVMYFSSFKMSSTTSQQLTPPVHQSEPSNRIHHILPSLCKAFKTAHTLHICPAEGNCSVCQDDGHSTRQACYIFHNPFLFLNKIMFFFWSSGSSKHAKKNLCLLLMNVAPGILMSKIIERRNKESMLFLAATADSCKPETENCDV